MKPRVLFLCLILKGFTAIANPQPTAGNDYFKLTDSLARLYHTGVIADTVYLNRIYRTADNGYGLPGFAENLLLFRKLAFARPQPSLYITIYYSMLGIDADLRDEMGRCIYYKEKEVESFKKYNPKEAVNLTMALFLTGSYANNSQYEKCVEAYKKALPDIKRIPGLIGTARLTKGTIQSAIDIIAITLPALAWTEDTAGIVDAWKLAHVIEGVTTAKLKKDKEANVIKRKAGFLDVDFWYHKYLRPDLVMRDVYAILSMMQSETYQAAYPGRSDYDLFDLYLQTARFLSASCQLDSAEHYLNLADGMKVNSSNLVMDHYYRIKAEVSEKKGDFKRAFEYMTEAHNESVETTRNTLGDRDNNLYAQAEAEERRLEMAAAEQQHKASRKKMEFLIGIISVLLVSGGLTAFYLRQRQRSKFLKFKLDIARNLHDETSPALLYAKALAKSARPATEGEAKSNIEQHIEHSMQVIRSLSHDLKADKPKTVGDLGKEIRESLKKLNIDNGFIGNVTVKGDSSRLLSHHQFSNLKSIIQEALSNTIKHADFTSIDIVFYIDKNKLSITYKDDGKGWDTQVAGTGIGMDNMKERAKNINGSWALDNNHPNGYQINILVSLR